MIRYQGQYEVLRRVAPEPLIDLRRAVQRTLALLLSVVEPQRGCYIQLMSKCWQTSLPEKSHKLWNGVQVRPQITSVISAPDQPLQLNKNALHDCKCGYQSFDKFDCTRNRDAHNSIAIDKILNRSLCSSLIVFYSRRPSSFDFKCWLQAGQCELCSIKTLST